MGVAAEMPAITGHTRLVGLLGWPVAHSRSPQMHNAAFAACHLDYVYLPLPASPERLAAALGGLVALGFAGANVTVPHKQAVLPYLAALSPAAQALGAVNTLVVQPDGSLYGDNTDAPGFLDDLAAHGYDPAGRRALLLGAGGAARAVAYALATAGARVIVANRTLERARSLCTAIGQAVPGATLAPYSFPEALADLAADADLIVNATSLGLHPGQDALPWDGGIPFHPGQVVYDLVYVTGHQGDAQGAAQGSARTALLETAAAAGAVTIDGLGMLVHQGARAFEIWTGQTAPVDVMYQALRASQTGS